MRSKLRAGLLMAETAACFALPAYLLFWGIITAPAWYFAALRGGTYAIWTLSYVVGGCLGIIAIISLMRYLISSGGDRQFAGVRNTAFALAGLVSLWGTVTDDFRAFDLNPFTVLIAILPSSCFAHLVFLAFHKPRTSG
jgi:hypothetical protein